MKTFKEYITEAKQVGIIYHFTTIYSLNTFIDSKPPFVLYSSNGENVSTTRNKFLFKNKYFKSCDVRIKIDGNELSNKYKVKPLLGLADNKPDIFNLSHKNRVKRSSGEAEEVILDYPVDIFKYIVEIDIIKSNNVTDELLHKLDTLDIIYNLKEKGYV